MVVRQEPSRFFINSAFPLRPMKNTMKYLFVPAKVKGTFLLPEHAVGTLCKDKQERQLNKLALSGSIQFVNSLPGIKKQLEEQGFGVDIVTGTHSVEPGQIVGCDYFDIDESPYDLLVYIGDGVFHPKAMMMANDKEIFAYNPFDASFSKLDRSLMVQLKRRHKGAILKFLSSQNIGVLVTIKPGQNRSVFVPKLKQKFPDKNYYVIVFDTVDFGALEDFNFVDMWVNTTCPRLAFDDTNKLTKPCCNINDLLELQTDS